VRLSSASVEMMFLRGGWSGQEQLHTHSNGKAIAKHSQRYRHSSGRGVDENDVHFSIVRELDVLRMEHPVRFWSGSELVLDEPHDPACGDGSADEEGEAEGAKANHHAWFGALGDAEDHRGKE
jgi:hypothetical protein